MKTSAMRPFRKWMERGFTLVELLVVIAVIVLLIALLLPSLSSAKELARKLSCLNNVRQMLVTLNLYANDYGGGLPANYNPSGWSPYTSFPRAAIKTYMPAMKNQGVLFRCPSASEFGKGSLGDDCSYGWRSKLVADSGPLEYLNIAKDGPKAVICDLYWYYDTQHHCKIVYGAKIVSGGINVGWLDGCAKYLAKPRLSIGSSGGYVSSQWSSVLDVAR